MLHSGLRMASDASEKGFAFERRIQYVLEQIKSNLEPGWTFEILGEQQIRDHFKEQSLNVL